MTPILTGIVASGISGHLTPPWSPEGAYDALATVTLSTTTASVIFSGIPAGYKHLQVRCLTRGSSTSTGGAPVYVTVNGDTGANYSTHCIIGNGSTAYADDHANALYILDGFGGFQSLSGGDGANSFGVGIIDLLDYSSTAKYKTARALWGRSDNTTTGRVVFESGSWRSTDVINSLTFTTDASYGVNWGANTQFALYGVK